MVTFVHVLSFLMFIFQVQFIMEILSRLVSKQVSFQPWVTTSSSLLARYFISSIENVDMEKSEAVGRFREVCTCDPARFFWCSASGKLFPLQSIHPLFQQDKDTLFSTTFDYIQFFVTRSFFPINLPATCGAA